MKTYLQIAVLSTISLVSLYVQAEEQQQEKNFSIGFGTYALALTFSDPTINDADFGGLALNASYAFTDNVAVKGAYYSLEHDDISELKVKGLDLAVVAGTGLATQGFKIYGGGGLFNETWEESGIAGNEKFTGLQLVGGLGYNWEVISLDFSLAIRDADDYVDSANSFGAVTDVSAVSGALTLSARF